ncbi:kinase-like domain-containing protein [Rhizophagus irregularis DAOM 181602=DAOM 197198]|nr:kinase-like domain-containing protein [Rhizophagus irregularis DAOM 181602=DAOM 197198]
MSFNNENQLVSKFDKLNISDKDLNSSKINHENCYDPDNDKFWCKECVRCIIEGWTSGNDDIDNFIKDTIYDVRYGEHTGEGGFAKVYSVTWIDGMAKYIKQDDGNWIKEEPKSIKVALKLLNESQNMSADFLNEFYGITKDPETEEIMMVLQYAKNGNLRNVLSNNFNKILWNEKINYLRMLTLDLKNLHEFGYFHRNFHSGNILNSDKIYGVLPYIAPEVLNGEPYTLSSDIYSIGVIMAELSTGKPPFYKRNHDNSLALKICNGLKPEFEKGAFSEDSEGIKFLKIIKIND